MASLQYSIYLLLAAAILVTTHAENATKVDQATEMIKLILPANYSKVAGPAPAEGPVQMNVTMKVTDISSISETSSDFTIDLILLHIWNEPRINLTDTPAAGYKFSLDKTFAQQLWLPDTYFENAKTVTLQKTVSDDAVRVIVYPNGHIIYSIKISILARCSMDLTYFPVDQQRCTLQLGSYGVVDVLMKYNWLDHPQAVEFNPDISLPTYRLLGYSKRNGTDSLITGNYSMLYLDLYVTRSLSFYITKIYLPACLVVFISWVPFWLDRDHHARVALGVTTILTMTTLITNSDLPKTSHLSTLDVYLFFCFLLVFLSMIEYASVGYYDMKCAKAAERQLEQANGNNPSKVKHILISDTSAIDYTARRLFPLSFAFFNVIYIISLFGILWSNSQFNSESIQVKL